jgi:hypothetical protein
MEAMHKNNVWFCRICDREFQDEDSYGEHISDPAIHDSAANLSPEELAMLVRMNTIPKRILSCFFCGLEDTEGNDMSMHMAEHLRYFALASIPWHVLTPGQSENGTQSAHLEPRSKENNSSLARMEQFIDDVSLPHESDDDEREEENKQGFGSIYSIKNWPQPSDRDRAAQIHRWMAMTLEDGSSSIAFGKPEPVYMYSDDAETLPDYMQTLFTEQEIEDALRKDYDIETPHIGIEPPWALQNPIGGHEQSRLLPTIHEHLPRPSRAPKRHSESDLAIFEIGDHTRRSTADTMTRYGHADTTRHSDYGR